MGFSKELIIQAQLTSRMVNCEDLSTPGDEAGAIILARVFRKNFYYRAQLTSGLVNSEDLSTPGEPGRNYKFGMGFFKRTFTTGSANLQHCEW